GVHSSLVATSLLYDGVGGEVKRTMPMGRQATIEYFDDELVKATTGQPNGTITHVTSYAYDANGNRTSVTDPMGNTAITSFFSDNLVSEVRDALGDKTSYQYDNIGNPTQV